MNKNIGIFGKNQIANMSLYQLMKKEGYTPVMSRSIDVFLTQLQHLKFDIIFCNFINSDDYNYQIVDKILINKPEIKIICVISKNSTSITNSLFKLGVTEIIEAPFNYQNLIEKFNRIVFNSLT